MKEAYIYDNVQMVVVDMFQDMFEGTRKEKKNIKQLEWFHTIYIYTHIFY
jgi:hypothetical protein